MRGVLSLQARLSFENCSKPLDCSLFATTCTPQNPIGSCMVSSQGGVRGVLSLQARLSFENCSKPLDCSLFATTCTPQNPIGSCMVSSQGGVRGVLSLQARLSFENCFLVKSLKPSQLTSTLTGFLGGFSFLTTGL
ncbi:hypothetical protein FE353_04305 [Helicobacter pylori]|nr:hypothetical protein FE353_04305 [Helicobacter pylori]